MFEELKNSCKSGGIGGFLPGFYYFYYVASKSNVQYKPNSEQVPIGSNTGNSAELLFFYADWCPHCKTAKPIWNDLKSQYENKTINGNKLNNKFGIFKKVKIINWINFKSCLDLK